MQGASAYDRDGENHAAPHLTTAPSCRPSILPPPANRRCLIP